MEKSNWLRRANWPSSIIKPNELEIGDVVLFSSPEIPGPAEGKVIELGPSQDSIAVSNGNQDAIISYDDIEEIVEFNEDTTDLADKLEDICDATWDSLGITSGDQLDSPIAWRNYIAQLNSNLKLNGISDKIPSRVYYLLEADNYHSLNEGLIELNKIDNPYITNR